MSDDNNIVQSTISVDGKTLILFNNRKPDSYFIGDIYDPSNPQSGKYFPSMYSLVIKSDGSLWYVSARNELTYEVTLTECRMIDTSEYSVSKIISYGNDKFCLYQDVRTNPFKLVIDAKLLFYGNNLIEYALYRKNEDGDEECISMYYDSAGNFHSNRIPMASVSDAYPAYKFPTNCHTTTNMIEGEPVICRVFNNLGNLAAEVTLFVRDAIWLNDLNSATNPIVSLDAECEQMTGDDFYIYEKQDPQHLNIRPFLTYSDGTKVYVNIDNSKCFLYGLEHFVPSYPGYSQTLILKYYLSYRETAIESDPSRERRFLTCTKKLIVMPNLSQYTFKISVVPISNKVSGEWSLKFFAYNDSRDTCYDITQHVKISDKLPFDGTYLSWGKEQHVEFTYDLQDLFQTDEALIGVQHIWITVWDPNHKYEKYTFRDSETSTHVFGVDGPVTRRPILHYDDNLGIYFIPTSIFRNWDAVLESFYYLADPPYDAKVETQAPAPTHFLIRDVASGQMLLGGPVAAREYGQQLHFINGTESVAAGTVIVEFLQEVEGNMTILYGVPVDVKNGQEYNTEDN